MKLLAALFTAALAFAASPAPISCTIIEQDGGWVALRSGSGDRRELSGPWVGSWTSAYAAYITLGLNTDGLAADARPTWGRALAHFQQVVVGITFVPAAADAPRTVAVRSISLGDRILDQSYFPAPPNPEPIAGDIGIAIRSDWDTPGGPDLFTIFLHALGHAIGLNHETSRPSVMYPVFVQAWLGYPLADQLWIADKYVVRPTPILSVW